MSEKFQLQKYKYWIASGIFLLAAGAGVFIRYKIVMPSREAASYLEAINGLTVGKTTEAELLQRDAFQKAEERCSQGECKYFMTTENKLLGQLHLAPKIHFSTIVSVRENLLAGVVVFTWKEGQPAISLRQGSQLPSGCDSEPCVKLIMPPTKVVMGISINFSSNSALRNQMPTMVNVACLSRLHGCPNLGEFMPIAKTMNLEPVISASRK